MNPLMGMMPSHRINFMKSKKEFKLPTPEAWRFCAHDAVDLDSFRLGTVMARTEEEAILKIQERLEGGRFHPQIIGYRTPIRVWLASHELLIG